MASEDSTDLFVNGEFKVTLDAGENYVVELPEDPGLELTSSAPVQVDVSLTNVFGCQCFCYS
jgi:hypothetical protein